MSETVKQAVELLRDNNLAWSSDMQDIRLELAMLIEVSSQIDMTKFIAEGLAKRIMNPGTSYSLDLETR